MLATLILMWLCAGALLGLAAFAKLQAKHPAGTPGVLARMRRHRRAAR